MKIDRPGDIRYIQVIARWFQTYSRNKRAIWRYSVYLHHGIAGGLGQVLEFDGSGNQTYKRQGSARLPRTIGETR